MLPKLTVTVYVPANAIFYAGAETPRGMVDNFLEA